MGAAYITRGFECATKFMWVISQNALSLVIAPPSGENWGRQQIMNIFGRCDVYSKFGEFWGCSGSEKLSFGKKKWWFEKQ